MSDEIGYLGFNKYVFNVEYQYILAYDNLFYRYLSLSKDPQYSQLIDEVKLHPKFKNHIGRQLNLCNNSVEITEENLSAWYLWLINNIGLETARSQFFNFLESNVIKVNICYWIQGVRVDTRVDLGDGFSILPLSEVQTSRYKEVFMNNGRSLFGHFSTIPNSVIVKTLEIEKFVEPERLFPNDEFIDVLKLQEIYCWLLNGVPDISANPYGLSVSSEEGVPFSPLLDQFFVGLNVVLAPQFPKELVGIHLGKLQELVALSKSIDDKRLSHLKTILERASRSKFSNSLKDKFLDLGLALEMLIMNRDKSEIAFQFALRGSRMLGEVDFSERELIFKLLRRLYEYRSQVAHNGMLRETNIGKLEKDLQDGYEIFSRILLVWLKYGGNVDYNKLILS